MRPAERGAALLEVLIAVALTALLAGAAGGIVRFGLGALERAGAASDRGAEALALRREIFEMLARIDRETPEAAAISGDADAATWRGVVPGADGEWRSGIWRLSGRGLALERCETLRGPCAPDPAARKREAAARFSYGDGAGGWRDDWPAGGAPELIRLRFGAGAPLDEIVVAPRVRGAAR
ncbi:hypothetical protein [Pikeienuella sp. HZG-20]|uniref:hypothetical protein n=1 Tax=Paludibacillus litoralis TaxID=3133267 RepID=UPI0030EE24DF